MQLLLIARILLQQMFQEKSDIQRQFAQIVSHRDKLQVTVENGFPESVRFHIVPLPNQYTGNWKVEI